MCAVCVRHASILVAVQMAAMKTANKELKQTYKTMKIEDVEVGTRAHCDLFSHTLELLSSLPLLSRAFGSSNMPVFGLPT